MFKHLHIVACSPRSGTTLLHEAMVACFDIDKFYDHEMRFNLVSAEDQQILLTKRPKDTMYIKAIRDSVPVLSKPMQNTLDFILLEGGQSPGTRPTHDTTVNRAIPAAGLWCGRSAQAGPLTTSLQNRVT